MLLVAPQIQNHKLKDTTKNNLPVLTLLVIYFKKGY